LYDHRSNAIVNRVVAIELHDEIVDWMDSLDDDEWDRRVVVIDRLADLGSSARMPLSRSLGDGLFELRFTLGPPARRVTSRFTKDGRVVLLTTFRKQRKNEGTEIARARKVAEDLLVATREGEHHGQLLPLGGRQEEAPRAGGRDAGRG
jgi:putative component of toxin-antitoxin plasmid stabilization module